MGGRKGATIEFITSGSTGKRKILLGLKLIKQMHKIKRFRKERKTVKMNHVHENCSTVKNCLMTDEWKA